MKTQVAPAYKPSYANVYYCFHCSDYGHLMEQCPASPQQAVYYDGSPKTFKETDEQSTKPQKMTLGKMRPELPALDMLENTDVIAAFLRARGVQPAAKLEENKKRLAEWAATVKVKICYIPEQWQPLGHSRQ